MKSEIAHKIKHRQYANDEFPTPPELCKSLIKLLPIESCSVVLEPAVGSGMHFPSTFGKYYKCKECSGTGKKPSVREEIQ